MSDIRVFTTAEASDAVLTEIRRLLDDTFEGRFSEEDWDHTLGGRHVVVAEGDVVLAHAAVVPRTLEVAQRSLHTGYVEGVGTASGNHGRGLGSLAMAEINEVVRREFDMGALSTDRHGFYERLGWQRWLGPSLVRRGPEVVRTEEEDDGVMVLLFGPSQGIDLTAPLTCEARSGDDW